MSADPHPQDPKILAALDAATGRLWPGLSPAERRARAIEALGLTPCGPFGDRMVYVEARPRG